MRSQTAIAERFKQKQASFLNFEPDVLIEYLDFEHAKPFLKPEVVATDWPSPHDEVYLRTEMAEYMEFAIGKAEDHRSISAIRSINKMCAWLFLLEDNELLEYAEDDYGHFAQYGAPILKAICGKYFPEIQFSDRFLRMAQGLPCQPGCEEGCG